MQTLFSYLPSLVTIVAIFGGIALLGVLLVKFYTLVPKEKALIRTGVGGEKVMMSGGLFVLPGFHKAQWVSLRTVKLSVKRDGHDSLITGDKLRVDVNTEFFLRVSNNVESVATASQTLGDTSTDMAALKNLVEAKFIDALRSVAATMTMHELHEKRAEFVRQVQALVKVDLEKNGLELESVALTSLNQTEKSFFSSENAFDAEGLAALTRQTEARRKEVNAIEQETRVAIATKDLEATQQTLALKRATSEAELRNAQEIATMTATQAAEVARVQAEGRAAAEAARLEAERRIGENTATTQRAVKEVEITAATALQVAAQDQAIAVANKSREEASAAAQAAAARAEAVKAEERVTTAREVEIAERNKAVALVKAEERAREDSTAVVVAAEAQKTAAEHIAAANRTQAEGERDAAVARAAGTVAEGEAEARALHAKNEAANLLSPELIAQQVKLALFAALPGIIEQSVKPMQNIDSIRIAEVGGLSGGASGSAGSAGGNGSNGGGLGNEVVNAALRYRTAQPVVDGLLAEVGLKGGGDMNALLSSAAAAAGVTMGAADAAPAPVVFAADPATSV